MERLAPAHRERLMRPGLLHYVLPDSTGSGLSDTVQRLLLGEPRYQQEQQQQQQAAAVIDVSDGDDDDDRVVELPRQRLYDDDDDSSNDDNSDLGLDVTARRLGGWKFERGTGEHVGPTVGIDGRRTTNGVHGDHHHHTTTSNCIPR